MSQAPSSRKPAGGCLRIIIGLLLALPAVNALVLLVPMLTRGFPVAATEEERLLLRLFTGATFLLFGGGSLALLVSGGRAIGRRHALQAQTEAAHPDEPWLWHPDWAAGRIPGGGPPIALAVIAVLWNTFVWKLAAGELTWVILEKRWELLPFQIVPAVFLALGLHLARVAVREMARWLRFRPVSLRLETLPGIIGGRFRGWIEAGGALPAGAEVVVGISCSRATKKGSKTRREVVWQDERPAHSSSLFADSLAIPIEFAIPSGLPESSPDRTPPCHTWRLRARARIAGPDFEAEFEIPVFSAGARREIPAAETAAPVEEPRQAGGQDLP